MERAFMNEAALVCLTFASYRLTQRHLATGSRRALLGLGASTTLIAMVKAPYLIAWAGILGLYAEKLGARTMRRAELGAIGLANLGAVYLWYSHARALGAQTGLSFDMTDKLYSSSVVFTTLFLRRVEGQIRQDVLGLPAVLLLLVGLALAWREGRRFEVAALAGFAGYVVILARGCMVHDYYLLAVVPAAAVLVPVGLCALAARIGRGNLRARGATRRVLAVPQHRPALLVRHPGRQGPALSGRPRIPGRRRPPRRGRVPQSRASLLSGSSRLLVRAGSGAEAARRCVASRGDGVRPLARVHRRTGGGVGEATR
jgi:hypothetical protein